MISRLTFCAAIFAAIATVSLAYAADSAQQAASRRNAPRRRFGACRDRGHAHGRSHRSPHPLRSAIGAARPRKTTAPGPHELVSCGPFLLPGSAPAAAKFRAERRSRNRRRYRNDRGWRSHGGNSSPDPARHAHLKTSMESHRLLPFIAGFAISAALLWLGAERLRHGPRPQPAQQPAPGAGRPAHRRLRPVVAGPLPRAGRAPAAVSAASRWSPPPWRWRLAGLAGATAVVTTRKTLPAFAGLALLTLGVAYAHSLFATPGLFRASAAIGSWGPAGAILVLATMLVGLGLEFKPSRKVRARASLGAAIGALLLTLAAAGPGRSRRGAAAGLDRGAAARRPGRDRRRRCSRRSARRRAATPSRRAAPPPPRVPLVDSLTQLPTRVYFEDRLAAAATKADANASRLALLFIDLDGFKPVNDTYGHSIGDLVLEQVGQRLKAMSRGKDVGRPRRRRRVPAAAHQRADPRRRWRRSPSRLIQGLSQPYAVEGREVDDLVLGRHRHVPRRLQPRQADRPRRRGDVRRQARRRLQPLLLFEPRWTPTPRPSSTLLRDLRKAVAAKAASSCSTSRRSTPRAARSPASRRCCAGSTRPAACSLPSVFIPIAERFGLIGAIGNWVIEDACRQSRAVARQGPADAGRDQPLGAPDAPGRHRRAHHRRARSSTRIHPSLLTCEITESAAMEDTKTTQATFRRLGELGTHLSIDDFGTGYSSLAYLRKLPAEELKIDRSFVMDLEHSADARAVVDAVIKLAHALGLKVVAEGVENQRQQQVLVELRLRRAAGLPVRQADVGAGAAALGDQRPPGNRRLQAVAVRRNQAVGARLRAAGGRFRRPGRRDSSPRRAARRRKCPVHRNAAVNRHTGSLQCNHRNARSGLSTGSPSCPTTSSPPF